MAVIASGSLTERYSGWFPLTYETSVPLTGGQIVVADVANPGKVKVAPEGATNWLGMAKYFGAPSTEFQEWGPYIQNAPVNSPVARLIACPHVGCYDVINAGAVTLNPGDAVQVVGDAGGIGRTGTTGTGDEPAGRAVVGTALGHMVSGSPDGYKLEPTPPGQKFRIRLGRG